MRTLKKSEEKAVSCGIQRWGEQQKRLAYTRFNHRAKTAGEADSDTYCQEYTEHTYSVGPQLIGIKAAAFDVQSRKLHHTQNTSPSITKGNFVPSSTMMKRMRYFIG